MKKGMLFLWLAVLVSGLLVAVVSSTELRSQYEKAMSEERAVREAGKSHALKPQATPAKETEKESDMKPQTTPAKEDEKGPVRIPQAIPKLDPELDLGTDELVGVIVYLKDQPRRQIRQAVKQRYQDELDWLESEIRAINRKYALKTPSAVDPEPPSLTASDRAAISHLNRQTKEILILVRQEVVEQVRARTGYQQDKLSRYIESLGGRVIYGYTLINGVAARVSGTDIQALANRPSVLRVAKDRLMDAHLNRSTYSINADYWWDNGYKGGSLRGAVLDTGIDELHPSLEDHSFRSKVFHETAQLHPHYADNPNSTNDQANHGTHVSGIVWSKGNWEGSLDWTNFKGVAYEADYCINGKAGFRIWDASVVMYWSDCMKAADWAIDEQNADAINLSFGDSTSSDYTDFARFWDAVVDDEEVMVVISAGNSGPTEKSVCEPGVAYNVFCVGAMHIGPTSDRRDDVIEHSSSRGPTAEGRKKPDMVAPGHAAGLGINSCNPYWETGADFTSPSLLHLGASSRAAPHVMGSILLYQDWGGRKDPKVIRALFLNSCEDWGPTAGWDKDYGWGYFNLRWAWYGRSDYFTDFVYPNGNPEDHRFYEGAMFPTTPGATLVWNKHVVYGGASYPGTYYDLNDLNLRLYRRANGEELDNSASTKDNVEQVSSPVPDTIIHVYIKVEAFSSVFDGVTTESYALATDPDFVPRDPPEFFVEMEHPAEVGARQRFTVSVPVTNRGEVSAFNTLVTLSPPSGFTIVAGENPWSLGRIGGNETKTASWTVEAPPDPGDYALSTSVTSNCYRETYTGSSSSPISVVPPLEIVEDLLKDVYGPPDPWTQEGLVELRFRVTAQAVDITHVTFSSDDLHHGTRKKKLAGNSVNFIPQEIGYLEDGDTVDVTACVQIPIGQHEGIYSGYFRGVAGDGSSDQVEVEIAVMPLADLDMDRESVTLAAFPGQSDEGLLVVVNPNCWANNPDPVDGPGNLDLGSIGYEFTDLSGSGGTIPSSALSVTNYQTSLGSGAADEVTIGIDVPLNELAGLYKGKVYVRSTYAVATPPDRNALSMPLDVVDSLTLRVGVLEEGILNISETHLHESVSPPDPWTNPLTEEAIFEVRNEGNDTLENIEFASCNLELAGHKPLDGGSVVFDPPVLGSLAPDQSEWVRASIVIPVGQYEGFYEGEFTAVASGGFSDFVLVTVEVGDITDLDIDDNEANLVANTMKLEGVAGITVSGAYDMVNPCTGESNCDPFDGPGNTNLNHLDYYWTDLVSHGGRDTIPAANVNPNVRGINSIDYCEAAQNILSIVIPSSEPLYATYTGTIVVEGNADVVDSFSVEVTIVPTSGGVPEVVEGEALDEAYFIPSNPWVEEGILELMFRVTSLGDLTHVSLTSDDLTHGTLDNKIDGSTVSFTPQEIGHLGPDDTVAVKACVEVPIGQHEGHYEGFFRVVACNGESDSVLAKVHVNPLADLDIQDYSDNMVGNEMNLVGCSNSVVVGAFDLISPNMMDNNVDLFDGPGNVTIENLDADWGHLWAYGENHKIHKKEVHLVTPLPDPVLSGYGHQVLVQVDIPKMSTPKQKTYLTPFGVTGKGAGVTVSDQFTLKVHVVPPGGGDNHISCFWGTSSEGENLLEWTGFGFGEIGYNIYRCIDGLTDFSKLNSVLLTENSYSDLGVFPGATYEYKLGLRLGSGGEIMLGPLSLGAYAKSPANYALLQNNPNPFSVATELKYQIAAAERITLRVYDSAGRIVRTLVDAQEEPGYYSVVWDGNDDVGRPVSAGVYIYRLQAGGFDRTGKMVRVR